MKYFNSLSTVDCSSIEPNLTIHFHYCLLPVGFLFSISFNIFTPNFLINLNVPLLLSRRCRWELITFPSLGEVMKLPNLPVKWFNTQIQRQDPSKLSVLLNSDHDTETLMYSLLVMSCCSCALDIFSCWLLVTLFSTCALWRSSVVLEPWPRGTDFCSITL